MNDELKHWIEDTEAKAAIMLEAAKRAREGEDITKFVICDGCERNPSNWLPRWDFYNHTYTLKPRRRLRPWTARDWANRFHGDFLVEGKRMMLTAIAQQETNVVVAFDRQTRWRDATDQRITQVDGSPCGEWEEVAP